MENKTIKIVFATGNPHKLHEINEISKGSGIEFVLPPDNFDRFTPIKCMPDKNSASPPNIRKIEKTSILKFLLYETDPIGKVLSVSQPRLTIYHTKGM